MRSVPKATEITLALGTLLVSLMFPHVAHAAAYHPTIATDTYQGKSDAALGFRTRWVCVTNVSIPTDPLACTREPGPDPVLPPASTSTMVIPSGFRPMNSHPSIRPRISYPGGCDYSGGVRMYQYLDRTGNCARFTGTGDLSIDGLVYPGGSGLTIGNNVLSLSTLGSNGYGYILCNSGDLYRFAANTYYNDLTYCDNTVHSLHIGP